MPMKNTNIFKEIDDTLRDVNNEWRRGVSDSSAQAGFLYIIAKTLIVIGAYVAEYVTKELK